MGWLQIDDRELAYMPNEAIGAMVHKAVTTMPPIKTTTAQLERCGSCGGVIRDTGECRCSD